MTAVGQPMSAWDAIARQYDAAYSTPRDLAEDDVTVSLIREYLPRDERVLDVGCGTAWLLDHFPHLPGYLGVDPSPGMLARAREKHPYATFVQGDLDWCRGSMLFGRRPVTVVSLNGAANWMDTSLLLSLFPQSRLLLGFLAIGRQVTWATEHGVYTPPVRYQELVSRFPDATIHSYGGLWTRWLRSRRMIRTGLRLEMRLYRAAPWLRDRALWHLVIE